MTGPTPLPGWRGGDANAAYLDKTLRHQNLDLAFDEGVAGRALLGLWLRAAIVGGLVFVVGMAVDSASSAAVLAVVAFFLFLLLSRTAEPIGEWRVLLMDRQERALDVYSQVRGTLRERQSPLRIEGHRLWLPGRTATNNRLRLTEGSYRAYVSVFPYGTSLYLGWTMWRSRRGTTLIRQFWADQIRGFFGQNGPEQRVMRTERPRAMREAVHLACREGLFVAVENRTVPESFGFPEGLPPVQESLLPSGGAAAPGVPWAARPGRGPASAPAPGPGAAAPPRPEQPPVTG